MGSTIAPTLKCIEPQTIRSLATGLANTVCSKESDIGRAVGVLNRQSGNHIRGCDGARTHAADSLARVGSQSVTRTAALFPFFPLPLYRAGTALHGRPESDFVVWYLRLSHSSEA